MRAARLAAIAAVALAVPVVVTANAVRLAMSGWFVDAVYAHGGLAPDPALTDAERRSLARLGLRAVEPGGRGGDLLAEARLPDGSPAFGGRELRHMDDVRRILAVVYPLHLSLLAALAAVVLACRPVRALRPFVRTGLGAGGVLTLAIGALVGIVLAVNADWFSTGFHTLFFGGDSWRFADSDTLRRVFPERFWTIVTAILAGAALVQAAALALLLVRRQAPGRGRRTRTA